MEIRTGRRDGDGQIRVSVFMDEMVAITLEGHAERAPTLLLTAEQARELEGALSELIRLVEEASPQEQERARVEKWQGEERRRLAS
ncbi:MAG TPA: hypothetical protein VJT09_13470 [Pyrinomonadaceae bacterium]|nr:hypothetical protein [Pyrinomonadaceae bacterium]